MLYPVYNLFFPDSFEIEPLQANERTVDFFPN